LSLGGPGLGRKLAALLAALACLLGFAADSALARGQAHPGQLRGAVITPNWSIAGTPFARSAEEQWSEMADLCSMRGNLVRLHVDWSQLQPGVYVPRGTDQLIQGLPEDPDSTDRHPGDYDPAYVSRLDQVIGWADECHIRVIIDLLGSPCWSIDPAPCRDDTWIFDPPSPGSYGAVSEFLLRRYPQLYALEVWNEPNVQFWKGTPAQYAVLVNEAVTARNETGSATRILAGSFLMNGTPYLEQLYAAGMSGQDGISIHPYSRYCESTCGPFTNPARRRSPFRTAITATHRVMRAHHDGGGIYLTEFGFSTCPAEDCVSERTAARWLASSFRVAATYPYVKGLTVFSMRDFAAGTDPNPTWDMHSGILHHDLTLKPAFAAVKREISQLRRADR